MKTLYEKDPTHWDTLAAQGKPALREMAKMFSRGSEIDAVLGYNNAASHWHSGRNGANMASNRRAQEWLDGHYGAMPVDVPRETPASVTFLCIADKATASKVHKVLGLLGCEFVEV